MSTWGVTFAVVFGVTAAPGVMATRPIIPPEAGSLASQLSSLAPAIPFAKPLGFDMPGLPSNLAPKSKPNDNQARGMSHHVYGYGARANDGR